MKKKTLIIYKYFYPGYKAGGPIRSLKNLTDALKDKVDIYVLTQNKDYKETAAYSEFASDRWLNSGGLHVFYSSKKVIGFKEISQAIKYIHPQTIYLGSFFDPASIKCLILNKTFKIPIIIAPRGQLQKGALNLKSLKKNLYIFTSKILYLYKDIYFHSTNPMESESISQIFPKNKIIESENVVEKPINEFNKLSIASKIIRFVYISRITAKKNLHFFLEILKEVEEINVQFHIYGPIENNNYWVTCNKIIEEINRKKNVKCSYLGILTQPEVHKVYIKSHFSVLTSYSENFAHSIYESLANSTPVLISNNTPWNSLKPSQAGYELPLDKVKFHETLVEISKLDDNQYNNLRRGALRKAYEYYNSQDYSQALKLFDFTK